MITQKNGFIASNTWQTPHPFFGTVQTLWDDDADSARIFPTEEAALEGVREFVSRQEWLTQEEKAKELALWVIESTTKFNGTRS